MIQLKYLVENYYGEDKIFEMKRPTEIDLKVQIQPESIAESLRRLRRELDELFYDESNKLFNRGEE